MIYFWYELMDFKWCIGVSHRTSTALHICADKISIIFFSNLWIHVHPSVTVFRNLRTFRYLISNRDVQLCNSWVYILSIFMTRQSLMGCFVSVPCEYDQEEVIHRQELDISCVLCVAGMRKIIDEWLMFVCWSSLCIVSAWELCIRRRTKSPLIRNMSRRRRITPIKSTRIASKVWIVLKFFKYFISIIFKERR